jgi:3-oxoacyl-[acyl-carrier-protein] synthase III
MEPILVEPDPKKGYIITHECTKCGAEKRCRAAHEARIQPDDIDLIIKLTAGKDRY